MNRLVQLKKKFFSIRKHCTLFFQQLCRSCVTVDESKSYFSSKHHLYGCKTEFSVSPIGLAIGHSRTHPGDKADIEIFRADRNWHVELFQKSEDEGSVPDID